MGRIMLSWRSRKPHPYHLCSHHGAHVSIISASSYLTASNNEMSMASTELGDALTLAVWIHGLALLVLAFSRQTSYLRGMVFLVTTILVWRCLEALQTPSDSTTLFRIYMCGYLLHASDFFLLRRLHAPVELSPSSRLLFASKLLFSPRIHISKKSDSSTESCPDTCTPSRGRFVAMQTVKIMFATATYNLLRQYFRLNTVVTDFAPPRHHLFRRLSQVTPREAVIRLHLTTEDLAQGYLLLTIAHTAASIFGCVILWQSPGEWPPLFGSLGDAYTVRRFYSRFWQYVCGLPHNPQWFDGFSVV
jgi:hypothetical protein